jgi:hypothetical protein
VTGCVAWCAPLGMGWSPYIARSPAALARKEGKKKFLWHPVPQNFYGRRQICLLRGPDLVEPAHRHVQEPVCSFHVVQQHQEAIVTRWCRENWPVVAPLKRSPAQSRQGMCRWGPRRWCGRSSRTGRSAGTGCTRRIRPTRAASF